jgi:protoheme IX farnesyltransferase
MSITNAGVREERLSVHAYTALTKPRTIPAHLLTAAAAMFLVAADPRLETVLLTLLGGGLTAAAANAFNSYLDRDIDVRMARTRRRPLPAGRLIPGRALAFAAALGAVGVIILGTTVSRLAGLLALSALLYYTVPYTLWLKRRTWWSTILCSGIGAMPPLIGSVAVTGTVEWPAALLGLIIVLWTVPHFWSLALFRHRDYKRAGVRVLPKKGTVAGIVAMSVVTVAATLAVLPYAADHLLYAVVASLAGALFLFLAVRLALARRPFREASRLYAYSMVYLALVFGAALLSAVIA